MAVYRDTIRNGVLIREKRRWFFFWTFNRSYEDRYTTLLNQRAVAKEQLTRVQRILPKEAARLADLKKSLSESHGGTSPPYRDSWSFRREPLLAKEPDGKPKKKDDKPKRSHPDEGVIAKLTVPKR